MNPVPPHPATGSQRNTYIDSLRGWSIFGVVCIHFGGSFVTADMFAWSPSFYLGLVLNQVFIFAVPLFVFLSGLLAGSSRKQLSLSDYYRARFWRIGFPYLLVSVVSFFFMNHYVTWLAIPGAGARFIWILQKVLYFGVEPTLYFIPLIILLYVVQPALKALPGWLNRFIPAVSTAQMAVIMTAILLVVHVVLGVMCFRNDLNYYVWGRPNPVFWMVYFFAGLHFRSLREFITQRAWRFIAWAALIVAVGAMAWNFHHILNREIVGQHFERNQLDYAYVRPEMIIYDLAMVILSAPGLVLGWSIGPRISAYLGRYTLEIYLWHILILYYGAWRYADALAACRQIPELILMICASTAILIAVLSDGWSRAKRFVRHHRLTLVEIP